MPLDTTDRLLIPTEVAQRLRCTRRYLEIMTSERVGPPSIKLGRLRRFPASALDQWIAEKLTESTPL
jgi:excisionase family DNA binding protein